MSTRRILILGGGYVGMYTAFGLQRRLRRQLRTGEVTITVVDPRSYMTYQPFLPEAAAGSLEPRHVVVPLRRVLPKVNVVTGRLVGLDHEHRTARIEPRASAESSEGSFEMTYDTLVVALGSVARTLPIPGLYERGIGFKQVEEAIALRNQVLDRLDLADATDDPATRRKALTFCFVGGGYAGVEALAELEDMARYATRYYANITAQDMRWVLIEASDRILPEVGERMGAHTIERLRTRGIDIRLSTRVNTFEDGHLELDDGASFDADTIVWTAGVKANPILGRTDLPLDAKGRLATSSTLRVEGVDDAWAAGDCAAVPDLAGEPGALCAPSAQHAVRQAKVLGANIARSLSGRALAEYRHADAGSVASLGLHKGVAQIYGIRLRGFPAWFMHRTYHIAKMPTANRKIRIVADWTLALFFRREAVSLGRLQRPREEFQRSAVPRRQAEADRR